MDNNLKAKTILYSGFKSKGEKRIADILGKYNIDYKYESPLLIQDDDKKQRIWHPDFYLPEYGIYLEYYGIKGNADYNNSKNKKNSIYQKMNLGVISIESKDIKSNNLEIYIINEIYRIQKSRYSNIQAKVYQLRTMSKMKY